MRAALFILGLSFFFTLALSLKAEDKAANECAQRLRQEAFQRFLDQRKKKEDSTEPSPSREIVEKVEGLVEIIRSASDWQNWFEKNSGYLGEGVYLFVVDSKGRMAISTRSEILNGNQMYMASYEVLRQELAAGEPLSSSPDAVVGGQVRILNGELSFFHTCSQFSCGDLKKFENTKSLLQSWGARLDGERVAKFIDQTPRRGTYEDMQIAGGGYYGDREEARMYIHLQEDPTLWQAYHRHRAFLRDLYFMNVLDPKHPGQITRLAAGNDRAGKIDEDLLLDIIKRVLGEELDVGTTMRYYNAIHSLQDQGAVIYTHDMRNRLQQAEQSIQEIYNLLHRWNTEGGYRQFYPARISR